MEEGFIIKLLEKNNIWWKKDFKIDFRDREIYATILKFMHMRHVIALTGLRRTGKTTITPEELLGVSAVLHNKYQHMLR